MRPGPAPGVDRREARAMGSPLRLQVGSGVTRDEVDRTWNEVRDAFEATEAALSRFRPTSEIHRLRLAGGTAPAPSRRLVAALCAADRARRMTGGRFDPRVLADLERLGLRPIDAPLAVGPAGVADSGEPLLRRDGRRGPIEVPVPVDFGGIGKGLALRWAARRAATRLAGRPFLLEAGGDIVGVGQPAVGQGWRIGIESPTDPDQPLAVVELPATGGAIATSSIRLASWRAPDARPVHHLIDPRTGEPGGAGLLAVTVQAPDPAWAEVWTKALFLEGLAGIAARARALGLAAWWSTEDDRLEMTPAARVRTIWVAGEAA